MPDSLLDLTPRGAHAVRARLNLLNGPGAECRAAACHLTAVVSAVPRGR